ncbi:hypothetical protein BDV12DRAFT_195919 [Aspergillus spectabilis]
MNTIAVIGGGWSGCHTALELAAAGHQVTMIEKGQHLFHGVSGTFGIRVHKGPHYPRSSGTREACRRSFVRFCEKYSELIVPVKPAIYSLARVDSTGHESKVNADTFGDVCGESTECSRVDISNFGSKSELEVAYKLDEPCAVLNPYLKTYFMEKLSSAGISIRLNDQVTAVCREGERHHILTSTCYEAVFDKVVNATGYTSALPDGLLDNLPIKLDIRYQACIALSYTDRCPDASPISFIVMDGWFPCLMPCLGDPSSRGEYILTHGAYTILGSFDTAAQASSCLSDIAPDFVPSNIRPKIEEQMERFWPGFTKRFSYQGWKGSVMPKLVTDTEFRSSVVFEADGVIYIFPGKISNVMEAADEVLSLIDGSEVVHAAGFGYTRNSELNRNKTEIEKPPVVKERNTCFLQTHQQLCVKT